MRRSISRSSMRGPGPVVVDGLPAHEAKAVLDAGRLRANDVNYTPRRAPVRGDEPQ